MNKQLKKDDFVHMDYESGRTEVCDDIKDKFQQVVEFYEKYRDDEIRLKDEEWNTYKLWLDTIHKGKGKIGYYTGISYENWLFNFCFKDGLK